MVSEQETTTGDEYVTVDRLAVALAEIRTEFANVRADIAERDVAIASLAGKIDRLGAELRGEIVSQGAELRAEISAQGNRLLARVGAGLGVLLVLDQLLSRI